eukprot:8572466-Heterocapsa_arctica.AAC.1
MLCLNRHAICTSASAGAPPFSSVCARHAESQSAASTARRPTAPRIVLCVCPVAARARSVDAAR